ncbi:MAG TPA: GAP family protein [Blastococcus sp.]
MSGEALVLALISIVRPTTAAAVWAMLVGARPRRLLTTYLLAGMAVSLTVGIAAVLLLGGVFSPRAVPGRRGVLLIVLGIVALVAAVAARLGRLQRFRPAEAVPGSRSRQLSPLGAATAGVLTHLPGVFYLAGLSAIAGTGAAAGEEVLQIVVYNLVWFAPAIVALGVCLYGTVPSADRLARPVTWARAHQEVLLVACFGVVGVWLIAKGISSLG